MNALDVQAVVFVAADGVARLFPIAAPEIAIAELALKALESAGIIPIHAPPINIDAVRAQAAGIQAAKSSVATEIRALDSKTAEPVTPRIATADPAVNAATLVPTQASATPK